ncbi:MAG: hypothetical protein HY747_08700, partial [Elusimicrobia bacterium]|nr:hypothetical protein [Elusimicrobiota bacterium]
MWNIEYRIKDFFSYIQHSIFNIPLSIAFIVLSALFCGCAPRVSPPAGPRLLQAVEPAAPAPELPRLEEGKLPFTLAWIVSPERPLDECLDILERSLETAPDFRITAALATGHIKDAAEPQLARLKQLAASGHVVWALEPAGSLPLPLLTNFRRYLYERLHFSGQDLAASPRFFLKDVEAAKIMVLSEEIWTQKFPEESLPGLAAPMGDWPEAAAWTSSVGNFPWILSASSAGVTGFDGTARDSGPDSAPEARHAPQGLQTSLVSEQGLRSG